MNKRQKTKMSTETMVLGAVLTALVVVLQYLGAFIRFGPFSISLVLIPIVIGASMCGIVISTWLGLVFGIVVLLSGDATLFMAVNPFGTIMTVLVKGAACGFCAGLVFKLVLNALDNRSKKHILQLGSSKKLCVNCRENVYNFISRNNRYIAVLAAAIVCPLVNTGVFLLGCLIFFMKTIGEWAVASGFENNVAGYMFLGLIGANFLFEMGTNLILSPTVVRLLNIRKK